MAGRNEEIELKPAAGHVEHDHPAAAKAAPQHVESTFGSDDLENAQSITSGKGTQAPRMQGMDAAMEFLANHADSEPMTEEENNSVRWKIDARLMPMMMVIYFLQQLDKASLSNASIFGIKTDANLVGQDYSWLSSIVYFAQLVFQPLSVWALVRMPVNVWVSGCLITWGAFECFMGASKSFASLAVTRFFLGGAEASVAPTFIIITSMWWTRREQPIRVNTWYSMNGLAIILGSLLTYGLSHIHSTVLYRYQIIFITCGLLTIVCSIPITIFFPARPSNAKFLNDRQKFVALERVRHNNTGTQSTHFDWAQVIECFLDIKTWIWVGMIFTISLVSGGISSFGPLILQGFGLDTFQTMLYNMIPGAISIVTNLLSAWAVTHFKTKSVVFFIISMFPLAGAAALYAIPHTTANKHKLLAVYFVLQVYACCTGLIYSWSSANTAGHTKKTTLTGLLYVGLCTGNIVGPQLYQSTEAPEYHRGLIANMICLILLSGFVVIQGFYLSFLNRRNIARRRAAGKTGQVVDYSLASSSQWAALREQQQAHNEAEGNGDQHNQQAFMDLTDLKNEDFVYSI